MRNAGNHIQPAGQRGWIKSTGIAVAAVGLWLGVLSSASAQLNENCTVSVLNRTANVRPDGSWQISNIPANIGRVRVRATCIENGVTRSGQSDFFFLEPNIVNGFDADILLGDTSPIPVSLTLTAPDTPAGTLTSQGDATQLVVTATFPDGSTEDVSTASRGTNYTTSNGAIATVNSNGLVTAVSSGTVLISAMNEGALGLIQIQVVLSGDSDGDGIPDDVELANGLDPNNPVDALEDFDGDGLTNKEELVDFGTNIQLADTDGDNINDGEEVVEGADGFVTNPLLADTDGDGIRDGLEIATGSNPTDSSSFNLAQALDSLEVTPASFVLTFNTLIGEASRQLTVIGNLIDGTTIDLTSTTTGTNYTSSDLDICNFGAQSGRVFAGLDGTCTVTATNSGFSDTTSVIVETFAPTALSFVNIPGFANNVDVNGDFAYVAAGSTGLQVVDVSDRTNPVVVASQDTPGNANDVKVVGNTAFVADGSSGLQIIDVTDPLSPVIIGAVDTPGVAQDVVVKGSLAYVADGAAGLQIIDLTAQTILGAVNTPGTASGVDVDTSIAVVADRGTGIQVVDISDPTKPLIVGSVDTGDAFDVVLNKDDDFAFVAEGSFNSFTSVDISDPTNPVIRATTNRALGGLLRDVALSGGFAFGADIFFVNGVPIIEVSDPANPVPRAILDFRNFRDDNGTGIAVDNRFLYLTANRGSSTRLYIGQYLDIDDEAGIPPIVSITSPAPGDEVFEETTLQIVVDAVDDIAVLAVGFLVDGEVVSTDFAAPYEFNFPVPIGVTSLTLGATAIDFGSNIGDAQDVVVNVIPDPPPTVTITSPTGGADVIEGSTITLSADATDNISVDRVEFFVDGVLEATDTVAPYIAQFSVPVGATSLSIDATATDNLGKTATDTVNVNVIPDPGTTVVGRILDTDGNPVEGATVTCLGISGLTGFDGAFSIPGLPTIQGDIRCTVTFVDVDGKTLFGSSVSLSPVLGGITDVGEFVILLPKLAFVVNRGSGTVAVVDTETRLILEEIEVGGGPKSLAVTPDGQLLYVTVGGRETGGTDQAIAVIDVATRSVVETIPARRPRGIAITPDGQFAYVTDRRDGVAVLRLSDNTFITTISESINTPQEVAITPDGSHVYVANNGFRDTPTSAPENITAIETATNTVVATVDVSGLVNGFGPWGVTALPDGKKVYSNDGDNGEFVFEIDSDPLSATFNQVTDVIRIGNNSNGPRGMESGVTPVGVRVYAALRDLNEVVVIDPATNEIVARVDTGDFSEPLRVRLNPAGTELWVALHDSGEVLVLDTVTNTEITRIPGFDGPNDIAFLGITP